MWYFDSTRSFRFTIKSLRVKGPTEGKHSDEFDNKNNRPGEMQNFARSTINYNSWGGKFILLPKSTGKKRTRKKRHTTNFVGIREKQRFNTPMANGHIMPGFPNSNSL